MIQNFTGLSLFWATDVAFAATSLESQSSPNWCDPCGWELYAPLPPNVPSQSPLLFASAHLCRLIHQFLGIRLVFALCP